ncbi:hypothetical protein SSPSH_001508 [Salinisphaera shabanensis E1L3A]|uniref:Uncharacterized protein n=1 Tax=Salinisphaera shabanensis E1L3A TaxID=1033802 RepID=U2ENM4_9GAMM|nr:DUF4149 domain-containing protein [Salinisphaera shabanensis]ERJ19440.1 hypothetical protein SSPSH_001508 [Salinisphaera shabanensis E1L3A]
MTLPGFALAVHVLSVVWWIGGLAFVTLVFLPALRRELDDDPPRLFEAIEHRFSLQARIALILTGLSGFYLLYAFDAWAWLALPRFWWLQAMIGYWLLFALALFVAEPLGLMQRLFFGARDPNRAWRYFHALHAALLAGGAVIIAAAVAANHGL